MDERRPNHAVMSAKVSKCEELALSICRPVYPGYPTLLGPVGTAEKCQEATYAVQQTSMQLMTLRARGW